MDYERTALNNIQTNLVEAISHIQSILDSINITTSQAKLGIPPEKVLNPKLEEKINLSKQALLEILDSLQKVVASNEIKKIYIDSFGRK